MGRRVDATARGRSRRLLAAWCILVVGLFAGVSSVAASGGGGGSGGGGSGGSGGGGAPPPATVPPIQLNPDALTLASGASEFVQFFVSTAPPAGGETLTITASNAALTVPATFLLAPGIDAQFRITANAVTVATPVNVTVRLGTASATVALTVTPALVPTLSSINAFPRVVAGGDAVTGSVALTATAPPGGVVVGLRSDSPLITVPATLAIAGGSNQVVFASTAGSVPATTIVHLTATLGTQTVTGQIEIDPARVLTFVGVGPNPTDASQLTTGGVSISVPADGNATAVALHSSNPAVAGVPALTGFLDAQSTSGFTITVAPVTAPTTVTITATLGALTRSTTLTVLPVPPPPFAVADLTVSPVVVAGNGTATATVTTSTGAPAGGATIKLSTSDTKLATVPATVFVPAGATTATFPVKVTGSGVADISIGATFADLGHAAVLGVTGAKGGSLIAASNNSQVLETHRLNDDHLDTLGFYGGGVASIESGQMPPGIQLISNLRPGEFVFHGSPKAAGTFTFVLKFENPGAAPYALPYVWVITPT